jgi:hypothetical protein
MVARGLGKRVRDAEGSMALKKDSLKITRAWAGCSGPWAPPSISLSKYLGSRKIPRGFCGLESTGVRVSALLFH